MPTTLCSGSPSEIRHQAYKWRAISVRLLAVCIAGSLLCSFANAQAPDIRNIHKRFRITIGGGWADYYMPKIGGSYPMSDHLSWPYEWGVYGRISGGAGAFLEAGYNFWRKVSVSAGLLHLRGAKKDIYEGRHYVDDYYSRDITEDEFRASMTSPFVEIQYDYPVKPVEFFAALGVTYIFANADYNQVPVIPVVPPSLPMENKDFHSRGIGYLTALGVSYGISKTIFVNSGTGYRFLKTGDLKDDDGRTWRGMNLDFSGPYFSAGLSFRL